MDAEKEKLKKILVEIACGSATDKLQVIEKLLSCDEDDEVLNRGHGAKDGAAIILREAIDRIVDLADEGSKLLE